MDCQKRRHARRWARITFASIAVLPVVWHLAMVQGATEGPLKETASPEGWIIAYSGDGWWCKLRGGWCDETQVSGTLSFQIYEQGHMAAFGLPGDLTGSWGGSGQVSLRYFWLTGDLFSEYERKEITFTGRMTSDRTAEGSFGLVYRYVYMVDPYHQGGTDTSASGRWSAEKGMLPEAAFAHAPDRIEAQKPVTFSASLSRDADGDIVSYSWDFGDGTTATGAEVSHTYAEPGRYTVTLRVTDDDGLEDEVSQVIRALLGLTISLQEGIVSVTWYGAMGAIYQLRCCPDLAAAPWIDIDRPVDGTDSLISVPVVNLAGPGPGIMSRCFYRVVELQ